MTGLNLIGLITDYHRIRHYSTQPEAAGWGMQRFIIDSICDVNARRTLIVKFTRMEKTPFYSCETRLNSLTLLTLQFTPMEAR